MTAINLTLEESHINDNAIRMANVINEFQKWPLYIKPHDEKMNKYVRYYCTNVCWSDDMWTYELRGTTVDLDLMSVCYSQLDIADVIIILYLNPTFGHDNNAGDNIFNDKIKESIRLRKRGICVGILNTVRNVLPYYSDLSILAKKVEYIRSITGIPMLLDLTEIIVYHGHNSMKFWWEMIFDLSSKYIPSDGPMGPMFEYCAPYEYYRKRCYHSDVIPLSVLTEGTLEEVEALVNGHAWAKVCIPDIPYDTIARRGIHISKIPTDCNALCLCIKYGLLSFESIIELCRFPGDFRDNTIGIIKRIRDMPEIEIAPRSGYTMGLAIIANGKTISITGYNLGIDALIPCVKPWKKEYINIIREQIHKSPKNCLFIGVKVHSSFREALVGDCPYWNYKNYWLYPEDITYPEHSNLMEDIQNSPNVNGKLGIFSNLPNDLKELGCTYYVQEQKRRKKVIMMSASRIGMVTDLACIIREYV